MASQPTGRLWVLIAWATIALTAGDAAVAGEGDLPWRLAWTYRPAQPPAPAFQGGLRSPGLVESIAFDHAFHATAGQRRVYFGSSAEEAVFCLDLDTGRQAWSFQADGPVRLAPTLHRGRLYFGSDDGHAYCLDAASGGLVWKVSAAPTPRRVIGNRRITSAWPVRSGVAVADDVAYFASGVLPPYGTYALAVDAHTGGPLWKREIPYSPHGQILVDGETLWLPTGRTCPAELQRADGTPRYENPGLRRARGSSSVRKVDGMIVYGPGESGMLHLRVSGEPPAEGSASGYPGGMVSGRITNIQGRCLVAGDRFYLVRDDQILAVDKTVFRRALLESAGGGMQGGPGFRRAYGIAAGGQPVKEDPELLEAIESQKAWAVANDGHFQSAVLAGELLFLGGRGSVAALDTATGERIGASPVDGRALGLVAAGESLLVSTDRGTIHAFRAGHEGPARVHRPVVGPPFADNPDYARAASKVLDLAADQGFCLVLGVGSGQLAWEIARQSELFVVALDRDAEKVREARAKLSAAGVYGRRVVVYHAPEDNPPYPDGFANLIVSEASVTLGEVPYSRSAVRRMLHPYGGTSWLPADDADGCEGPVVERRGPPDGAGQWTHLYANPANTTSSGDRILGTELAIQWFGPPGADDVVERHALAMPPLFCEGRLFVAGLRHSIRAVDAYNGTPLWKVEVPDSVRKMISHNAGFMAAAADRLFVAGRDDCRMLDAATGATLASFRVPKDGADWGYVAVWDGTLFGSTQRPAADRHSYDDYRFLVNARELVSRPVVSTGLFAIDYEGEERLWTYERSSVILNPTITVGGETVFFSESTNPVVVDAADGTADLPDFFAQGASLVALDAQNGRELWRRPLAPLSPNPADRHEHLMYLSYADGRLLATRTGHVDGLLSYVLSVYDAQTGEPQWSRCVQSKHRVYAPLLYGKNMQASHPAVVDGKIYWLAHSFGTLFCHDLATGESDHDTEFGTGWQNKGCAVPTASASALFYRDTSCAMYDLATRSRHDLTRVTRPGCWMSVIPAGGLVLMPEASAGCTCGFALQMSLVLAPAPDP